MASKVERRAMAFLHGGRQGSWVWDETIEAIRMQDGDGARTMLALDVPGCGTKRGPDTAAMSWADVISDLSNDIVRSGVQDFVLVGHSQAGTILPRVSASLGKTIGNLVYVTCCAPLPGQSIQSMMGTGVHGSDPDSVGWPIDPATNDFQQVMARMFCNDMTESQQASLFARMAGNEWPAACGTEAQDWGYDESQSMPSAYVIACADAILPVEWQHRFADRLGAAQRYRIDAGHQVMQTRPHALAEILRSIGDRA